MLRNRILGLLLTAGSLACFLPAAQAALAPEQVNAANAYSFAQSAGTYTAISGGTQLTTSCDDNNYNANAIPFTFNYNGTNYTQFSVNCNGFLALGATVASSYVPISGGTTNNVIAAVGMDLQSGAASSDLRYETVGTAPNRVLVVQWNNFRNYNTTGDSYNFQIRLHETSNVVEVVYGAFTKNATNRVPQVGIRGATNTDYSNRTTTTNWSASTAGGTNTATMALTTTVLPTSGQTYTWTPPNFPPAISYAALGNTPSTANRTLNGVAITDADGVDGNVGTRPRLYFKRLADANVWNDNTSGTAGWKYVEANGAASPFDFTINYALLDGGAGVVAGDSVQYFVVAQDLAATPAVAINAGTFAAAPASVALTSAAFPIGGTLNNYKIVPLLAGGTYQVPGSYASLTNASGAFDAINNSALGGNVTLEIAADLSGETGTVALDQWAESGSGNYTLTIKPVGAARTITGLATNALIKLNGADRVTIDGALSSGGTDRSLTIENTGGAAVIWNASASASNGATDNTFQNLVIKGSGAYGTAVGIVSSGTAIGGVAEAANSNGAIRNNAVTKVQNAFFLYGAASMDANWVIADNEMGSAVVADKLGFRGMLVANMQNVIVANNTIQGVVSSPTSSSTMSGVQVSGNISGGLISGNRISDIKHTSTTGWGSNGIFLAASSTASNLVVANNFVSDVASYGYASGTSQSDNGYGIMVASGGGYQIVYNSVSMNTNQTGGGLPAAINFYSGLPAASMDVRNNIFANTQTTGTRYAIYSSSANTIFSTIDHNDYFQGTGNVGYLGSARADLTAWQTATGQDANSISADPLFASATDLHIMAGSPALAAGTPIAGITTDIDGDMRSVIAPSIGADDVATIITYTVTAGVSGAGSISNAGANTVNSGDTISFTATANSGNHFVNFTGTCPGLPSIANPVTTGAITANCSITANFAVDAGTGGVVISQIYSGGGATGSYYLFDYVELFNAGNSTVNLAGYSLQYGSATGNFGAGAQQIYAFPSGTTIAAGRYLLVQTGTSSGGVALPTTPDFTTTNLALGAANGKVALAKVATGLGCGSTPCALPHANIADLVAWGTSNNAEGGAAVAALSVSTAAVRKSDGCQDTDNNAADFNVVTAPLSPRNAASPAHSCGGPVTYTVTGSVTGNGTISPSGAQTVASGDSISFTATADAGNHFVDFAGTTCPGTASGNVFAAGPITAACAVVANFALDPVSTFACNATPEGFDGGGFPPAGWTIETGEPTGPQWDLMSAFTGYTNETGGTGEAATVSSDDFGSGAYDSSLVSPVFSLAGFTVATLEYKAAYLYYSGDEAFDVDITNDGGATWTNLLRWTTTDYAPESVSINLASYVGQSNLQLRWRYYNADTSAWDYFAQVDDIGLTCGSGVYHTVTPSVAAPGGGTISPAVPQTVADGSTTTFTLDAIVGYHLDSVGGTCNGTLAGNSYTTAAVTGDCTVIASFVQDVAGDLICSATLNHSILKTIDGTNVNWITGAIVDGAVSGAHFNPYFNNQRLTFWWGAPGAPNIAGVSSSPTTSDFLVLHGGDVVGPTSIWSTTANPGPMAWSAGDDGYLGFRFNCSAVPGAPVSGICYGYAHLTTTAPDGFPATLVDYCYDKAGGAATIPGGSPNPIVAKSFAPDTMGEADTSVVTITLSNPNATAAVLSAGLTDVLPTGLSIVPGSGSTTCVAGMGLNASVTLPAGATIPANGSCSVTFSVTAAGGGVYVNTIAAGALQTNHGNNVDPASATLTVLADPTIEVDPTSLSATLASDATTTQTLTIRNHGDSDLNWTIEETSARSDVPSVRGVARPGSRSAHVAPRANPTPMALAIDEGFDDITTLTGAGWFMKNNSAPLGTTNWFQGNSGAVFASYDGGPDAYIGANYNNTAGAGVISNWLLTPEISLTNGTTVSFWTRTTDDSEWADRLQVRVSTAGASTSVGSSATSVGDFTSLVLEINEIEDDYGYPNTWTHYTVTLSGIPGGTTGRIAFRYYVSDGGPSGNGSNFIGIDRVQVDNAGGGGGGGTCANVADIPWLSVSPTSGTTVAHGSSTVTVNYNAAGMAPGAYDANLCVASNDPSNPQVIVPVALTVTASGQFNVTPSVTSGSGSGTISPASVQSIDAYSTATFTLTPSNGWQIDSVGGTCGGTLTGNTYVTNPVTANCTVEASFTLIPLPNASVTPISLGLVAMQGNHTDSETVTVGNSAAGVLNYSITRAAYAAGCDTPSNVAWLSVAPGSGTINGTGTANHTATANAAGMTPGVYKAWICVSTNDPVHPRFDLEVTFEVVEDPAMIGIFCNGFEDGEGNTCESGNGDIFVSGPINHAIGNDINGTSVNWITGDIQDADVPNYHFNPYNNNNQLTFWWQTGAPSIAGVSSNATTSDFLVLHSGAVIGPSSIWSTTNNPGPAAWAAGANGYLGFRFNCSALPTPPVSGICYGYVHLQTTAPAGFPATILDYAFDKAGNPITVP